jgi:hypothetical protein
MGDGGDRRLMGLESRVRRGWGRVSCIRVFLAESEPSEEHGEGVEARCGGEGTVRRG